MAYDDSAAKRTQSAEISSPRERARTDQQTAPTTSIAPQMAMDLGVIFRLSGCVGVIVDMVAPHASEWLPLRQRRASVPGLPGQHAVGVANGRHVRYTTATRTAGSRVGA